MSGTARGTALRVADRLRGGQVATELADIESAMRWSSATHVTQASRLTGVLRHARSHVPFYRRIGSVRLDELPVMNKASIGDQGDEMLAQGASQRRVYSATTSGSTGTPFRVLRDERKQHRIQAEAIYWGRLAGYELGQPLFHLKVWSARNRLSRVALISRNVVPVDVAYMQAQDYRELYAAMARHRGPLSIVAYSSALESLVRAVGQREASDHPASPPRIAGIITQSEGLPAEVRASAASLLGRMPYARYGMEELGILGQQAPGSGERFLVNRASHFVEILDLERDVPAGAGEVGRIVVTDLVNVAQPMIRYDTGDLGSFAVDADGATDSAWLQTVAGRRLDQFYDVLDRPLSPMLMYKIWWRFPEIRQHQLVQRGQGDYVIRLNVGGSFPREPEFVDAFVELVGQGARCVVEYTNEALVLSSGKRKSVVSEYTPPPADRFSGHALGATRPKMGSSCKPPGGGAGGPVMVETRYGDIEAR